MEQNNKKDKLTKIVTEISNSLKSPKNKKEKINFRKSVVIGIKNGLSFLSLKEKNKKDVNIKKDEFENIKEDNEEIIESNSEDEELNMEYLLIKIDDDLINKKYAKIVKELETVEKENELILLKVENIKYYIYIFEIKILCLYHLIDNKLLEYYTFQKNTLVFSGKKENLHDLEKNFLKLKKTLEKNIPTLKKYLNNKSVITEHMKEHILLSYARGIYIQGKFCKYKKQITDASSFFIIGINMLKKNIEKSIEPETFLLYAELLLSLSTILIQNKSYKKAMENLVIAQNYFIKVTFLKIDNNKGINLNYTIKPTHNMNVHKVSNKETPWLRSIKGIIICLLLLGICFEKNDELDNAVIIYNQSFWFTLKFYKKIDIIFYTIIESIKNLCWKYKEAILRELKNKIYEDRRRERLRILQEKNYCRAMRLARISNRESFNEEKYLVMEDKLNNVIEMMNKKYGLKNSKNKKMLPIIKYFNTDKGNFYFTYNYIIKENEEKMEKLLRNKNNKFNTTFNKNKSQNKKITLYDRLYTYNSFVKNNLDNTKGLKFMSLSRQNNIKNKKYKNNYLTPNRFLSSTNKILNNNRKNFSPPPKINSKDNLYSYNTISTRDNVTETNNTNFTSMKNINNNSNFTNKQKQIKFKTRINLKPYINTESNIKNRKPFITKNSFVFCKKFNKCCNSIDLFDKREINFQKNILHLKNIENTDNKIPNPIDFKEKEEIKDDAKFLFSRIRTKVEDRGPIIEINRKKIKPDKITLIQTEICKLENSLIVGLNETKIEEIKKLKRNLKEVKQNQTVSGLVNENMTKTLMNEKFDLQVNETEKKNKDMIGCLSNEIIECEERAMKFRNKKKTCLTPNLKIRIKK